MAPRAPKPGATSHKQETVIRISVRGEEVIVRPSDYGPRDDALVRRETKMAGVERMSLMGAMQALDEQTMGLDSVCLLWWLARRKAGETTMSFGDALDGFPSYGEAEDAIVFEEVIDDDDEGEADPLPPAAD